MKPTKANSQLANKRPFYTKEVMIRPLPASVQNLPKLRSDFKCLATANTLST